MPNLEYEAAQIAAGYPCIAGIDEAGRGPLAGPVSAAAVILPSDFSHDLLDDSKKITAKRRAYFESRQELSNSNLRLVVSLALKYKKQLRSDAVSYTHLTLPTILLV